MSVVHFSVEFRNLAVYTVCQEVTNPSRWFGMYSNLHVLQPTWLIIKDYEYCCPKYLEDTRLPTKGPNGPPAKGQPMLLPSMFFHSNSSWICSFLLHLIPENWMLLYMTQRCSTTWQAKMKVANWWPLAVGKSLPPLAMALPSRRTQNGKGPLIWPFCNSWEMVSSSLSCPKVLFCAPILWGGYLLFYSFLELRKVFYYSNRTNTEQNALHLYAFSSRFP